MAKSSLPGASADFDRAEGAQGVARLAALRAASRARPRGRRPVAGVGRARAHARRERRHGLAGPFIALRGMDRAGPMPGPVVRPHRPPPRPFAGPGMLIVGCWTAEHLGRRICEMVSTLERECGHFNASALKIQAYPGCPRRNIFLTTRGKTFQASLRPKWRV